MIQIPLNRVPLEQKNARWHLGYPLQSPQKSGPTRIQGYVTDEVSRLQSPQKSGPTRITLYL